MRFYLGTHMSNWLASSDVPLFVSRRRFGKSLPRASAPWALDSGGFTELNLYGEWRTTVDEYVADVTRYADEIGSLEWVAPQDWMVEPYVLAKTGLTVAEHQRRTIASVCELRFRLGDLVVPVLQGWTTDDYLRHVEQYQRASFDLDAEPLIGLGSVCRRQDTTSAALIVRSLVALGLRLHGFGVKTTGLLRYGDALASADSMAWSLTGRWGNLEPAHEHAGCSPSNCKGYALAWRERILERIPDPLWKETPCVTAR